MPEYTVPKRPTIAAATAASPPSNCSTSLGSTGAMMPRASMSSATVTKMKASAALRTGVAMPTTASFMVGVEAMSGDARSRRARLDHAHGGRRRHDAGERESRGVEERTVLRFGPFLAAGHHHHVEIGAGDHL